MKKITLSILILFMMVGVNAAIVNETDDDRKQMLVFDHCFDFDSIALMLSLDLDSGFVEFIRYPGDSVIVSEILEYIAPDRDEQDRIIPGHYQGDYYYYIDAFSGGDRIAAEDTVNIAVDYVIPSGCSGINALRLDW